MKMLIVLFLVVSVTASTEEVAEIDQNSSTVTLSDGTIVEMDDVSGINIGDDVELVICDGDICQDEE